MLRTALAEIGISNPAVETVGVSYFRLTTPFVNVAALTKHHACAVPMSKVLTFSSEGRHRSVAKMRCYLHSSDAEPVG